MPTKIIAHRIPVMLDMMPRGDIKVMDLGDWKDGLLAKEIRKRGYDTVTVGIERADKIVDLEKGRLPFKSGSFDCIVAGELFEHIFNLRKLLSEVRRVLKKGGALIVSVPNSASLVDRMKVLTGRLPTNAALGDYLEDHGHVRDFNWSIAREYLAEAGFKISEERTDGVIFRNKVLWRGGMRSLGNSIIMKAKRS
jgi:SAM-dependent methyltransferase